MVCKGCLPGALCCSGLAYLLCWHFFTRETPIPDVTLAGQGSEDGPDQASPGIVVAGPGGGLGRRGGQSRSLGWASDTELAAVDRSPGKVPLGRRPPPPGGPTGILHVAALPRALWFAAQSFSGLSHLLPPSTWFAAELGIFCLVPRAGLRGASAVVPNKPLQP